MNMSLEDEEVQKLRWIQKHWAIGSEFENFSVEYGMCFSPTNGRGKRFGVSKKEYKVSWPNPLNRYKHIIG